MYLRFIKFHLIVFEIISLAMSIIAVIGLVYYSFFFKNYTGLQENGAKIIDISFNSSIKESTFGDISINLYLPNMINCTNAYIILNRNYSEEYSDKSIEQKNKLINTINKEDPFNIFLFDTENTARLFINHLTTIKKIANTLNLTIIILILFFLVFLKITLMKISYKNITSTKTSKIGGKGKNTLIDNIISEINTSNSLEQKQIFFNPTLSFLNPIMIYYYIIFHLTSIIILPIIIPSFINYKVKTYFGFTTNLFYSIYYYRSNYGKFDNLNNTNYITSNKTSDENFFFFFHKSLDLALEENQGISNPYVPNLCFMCCIIWISQYFKPFDQGRNVKIEEKNVTKTNKKKILNFLVTCSLFAVWIIFFIWGIINTFDYLLCFHKLIFYKPKKMLDLRISIVLFLFYYHIYFYVIMIMHTIEFKNKNKNYHGPLLKSFSFLSTK